ncbi:hypothetical protein C8R48DRAFT_770282 [Suillus tomentosus]|nr:hypothetical protein C8R48DRAFT_770282 [Suillus tomentosus]
MALLGTLEGQGGNFPWKMLPTVLAHHGCILGNYPENILMPGERHATLAKSKGIHDLSLHEWHVLANALKDDVITIKSVAMDARKSLMALCDPIIVGEASFTDSPHTCGRRGFANGKIDRCGSTHLHSTSPSKSHATTSNPWWLCMFMEVPPIPPSWRLKAIQQHSLVLKLLQITTIKDGAIDEDTTEDEEEIDKLVGSQQRT